MTNNYDQGINRQLESILQNAATLAAYVEGMAAADPGLEQMFVGGYNADEFERSSGFWVADNARRQAEIAAICQPPVRRPRQQSVRVVINASMRNL